MDKGEFLKDVQNWDNHRNLLWSALEATKGTVLEFGCGNGSTPYLHDYCKANKRKLFSYETSQEWLDKFKHLESDTHHLELVKDWDEANLKHIKVDVVLIDHAPGERRKDDIEMFKGRCEYLIAHDTEPAADNGYKMRSVLKTFRFMKDFESPGAWATVVSQVNDVSKF